MIVMDFERGRKMKKWETIGLDGVIQMTREKAEGWKREGGETGGDGSLRAPLSLPLQSRTMRRSPNLSPDDEGSLRRPSSSSSKLSHILPLSLSTSSALSHLSEGRRGRECLFSR